MFGDINNVQRMLGTMSVPELVKIAQNPSPGDPTVQYAAISEIEKRKQMQPPPQAPVSQPTVIEKMGMEAMTPPQQAPVPGDPRAAGVAALVQQGAPPPRRMAGGGGIVRDMGGIMEKLSPYYDTESMTPEEARAMVAGFYGEPSYLDELLPGMKADEERARTGRNTDLWLALAQAGFGMASTGNIGEGAMMGLEQARGALNNYNDRLDNVRGRRERVGLARGQRQDQLSGAGLEALLESQRAARGAQQDLVSTSAGIAETGAQIEASRARDNSQLERLADMLYAENEDEVVWERYDAPGTEHGFGMRQRRYSRGDAMRDALLMTTSGRSSPDDLSERGTNARFLLDNRQLLNQLPPEARQQLLDTVSGIATGEIGNRGTSTTGQSQSSSGATAPSEAGFVSPSPEQIAAYQANRSSRVVGERDGQRVITPY